MCVCACERARNVQCLYVRTNKTWGRPVIDRGLSNGNNDGPKSTSRGSREPRNIDTPSLRPRPGAVFSVILQRGWRLGFGFQLTVVCGLERGELDSSCDRFCGARTENPRY